MLHPHPNPSATLLPHLQSHLPRSLPVLGALLFHASLLPPPSSPFAYASFPPTAVPSEGESWTAIVHQQPPSTNQLRLFNSLESAVDRSPAELDQAERQLRACLKAFCSARPGTEHIWVGALSELWIDRLGLGREDVYGVWLAPETDGPAEGETDVAGVPEGFVLRTADERDLRAVCPLRPFLSPSLSSVSCARR